MPIYEYDILQLSNEWFTAKCGKPGASSFDRILTSTGKISEQRKEYIYELCGERFLGKQEQGFSTPAMQRGSEMENESRYYFELIHGVEVKQVGLIYKDESKRVLCSPDGLIPGSGLEMKNRMLKHHIAYLATGKLKPSDFCQVQGSMWVTDYETWWFQSYYPGIPAFILEVHRDEKWIVKLDAAMKEFLDELDYIHKELLNK
jgi:hypothetical protein